VIEIDDRAPKCPSCQAPVESTFTMCPYCRSPLRLVCAGCGAAMKKKWTSCPFCGAETVAAPSAPRPLSEMPAPSRDLGAFEPPRILIVDDAPDLLALVGLTLRKISPDLQVETASSGEEALAKVEARRPHLIILDLMLPGMDGFEVCKRLRGDLKTALIPIVMLTALADADSRRLGNLAGTDDYLVKPFERSELIARVQRLLKRTYGWPADPVEDTRKLDLQVANG
jgi:CheY-like chemotaxis protein/RNA polymerase subunit RPABC4/transcription elongation factor Spt4